MGLLTRLIDAVRPRVIKDTRITPNSPTLIKMFGLADGDECRDPFSQIPIIYAAIRAVGKVISQTALKVNKGENEVGPNDPLVTLLSAPNPMQSLYEFKEGIGVNLQIKGNAFIVLDEKVQKNGLPIAIRCWPSRYFTPKYNGSNEWVGWDVKRGKEPAYFLPPERVVHISNYNPNDELMGLAPMDILKMTYKTMWDAMVYNKKFFENDGTPPIIYKAPNPLPDQYRDAFKKDVIERRKGKAHAHEAQLIEGMDVTTLGFTQKDIQFLDLLRYAQEEVLMVFGVTKTQVSKYEDVNYATALSQDKVFISNTCIPIMRQVESEINGQWLGRLGYTVRFDERSNEAMTYLSSDEAAKYVSLVNAGIIVANEAREKMGWEPVAWGDEPGGMMDAPILPVPKDVEAQPVVNKVADQPLPRELVDALGKARRTELWTRLNDRIRPVETRCAKAVRRYFYDAEKRVLAAVRKQVGGALVKVADPDIDNAFNDDELYAILRKYLGQSVVMGADSLGIPDVSIEDPNVTRYLGERVEYMKGINDTAKGKMKDRLHEALEQSLADKLTEEQRVELVRQVLNEGFAQLKSHARSIARTEVHGAFAEGRWQACEDINPSEIEWVSSRDVFVRDSHRYLDGTRVPYGDRFANGCRHPLDPAGGAGEVINCRCTFQIHI